MEEVEIQTKYSLPFACFVFGLFGAPLGIKVHRSGRRGGLGIGLIIVVADYILLLTGQALGREGRSPPYHCSMAAEYSYRRSWHISA
ncbi:MAG TPA: hypothetical protein DCQ99_06265 [Nitrospinae bacterium]|nr:hypothetical protein [Nitrospinota bacterium]